MSGLVTLLVYLGLSTGLICLRTSVSSLKLSLKSLSARPLRNKCVHLVMKERFKTLVASGNLGSNI